MLHHAEDGGEVMTPFQHASCLAGHRIESLPVREARILLDLKQGRSAVRLKTEKTARSLRKSSA